MNVILATAHKPSNTAIAALREVNVLTTLTRREAVVDRVLQLNPHVLVLGRELPGKLDWREVIPRVRELRPDVRIVFLYGKADDEVRLFGDFLVRAGIYDVLTGVPDAAELQELLQHPMSREAAEARFLMPLTLPTPDLTPTPTPTPPPERKRTREVLIVERIVERETVKAVRVGTLTVGVAGLLPRAGATHTALLAGMFLRRRKRDVGVVVSERVFRAIADYLQLDAEAHTLRVGGLPVYREESHAASNHAIVVTDDGVLSEAGAKARLFARTVKLLLCPCAAWEVDALTDFLRAETAGGMAAHVRYLFYPVDERYFAELRRNMRRGGARAWRMPYVPDWAGDTGADGVLAEVLAEVLE